MMEPLEPTPSPCAQEATAPIVSAAESAPALAGAGETPPPQTAPETSASPPATQPTKQKDLSAGPTGLKFITSVLVIVVFLITFAVQAFRVPSESMENTLLVGDFLLADKVHFSSGGFWDWALPYRPVRRGDIVVFRYPVDPSQYFVKRVVGLPGDRVRLENKAVYINGRRLDESYVVHNLPGVDDYRDNFPAPHRTAHDQDRRWRGNLQRYVSENALVVPEGQYFVMGDNRDRSLDSRYWGFVPRESIIGRPVMIYLSLAGPPEPEGASSNDKLLHSGQMLAHFIQLARWDRMFRLVR